MPEKKYRYEDWKQAKAKRAYADLPPELHARLKGLCEKLSTKEKRVTISEYLTQLIVLDLEARAEFEEISS